MLWLFECVEAGVEDVAWLVLGQPGPLGGQGAPVQATNQAQPDQAQPEQGGVPSDSDDDDRAGPSDVAMPDQATADVAAGHPSANFGQGQFLFSLCHSFSPSCIAALAW